MALQPRPESDAIHLPTRQCEQPLAPAFAYDQLDETTRQEVLSHTTVIRERTKRMVSDMLVIGTHLQAVKSQLRHGQFGAWLRAEFSWSQDTAERLMLVAHWSAENPHHAESADRFTAAALYLLVAPSTPEDVREQLVTHAATTTGGLITRPTVQAAINAVSRAAPLDPPPAMPRVVEPSPLAPAAAPGRYPSDWAAPALGAAPPVATAWKPAASATPARPVELPTSHHAGSVDVPVPLPLDPLAPPSLHQWFQAHGISLYRGDNRDVLRRLPANSVASAVCDPPAGINFLNAAWDNPRAYERADAGFSAGDADALLRSSTRNPLCRICQRHQRSWNDEPGCVCIEPDFEPDDQRLAARQQFIEVMTETFRAVWRVVTPGGHIACWAFPVTSHWTMTALENAGWELRCVVTHHYGQGFPKSINISKMLDRCAGTERQVISVRRTRSGGRESYNQANADQGYRPDAYQRGENVLDDTAPATPQAEQWSGWGTALKPGTEFWIIARKPLAAIKSEELFQLTGWEYWCSRHTKKKAADLAQFTALGYEPLFGALPDMDDDEESLADLDDEAGLPRPPQPHFILERRRSLHPGRDSLLVLHHAHGTTTLEQKPYRPWTTSTVAANVLKFGTGALNIDAARIRYQSLADAERARQNGLGPIERAKTSRPIYDGGKQTARFEDTFSRRGRWPADMILTHTDGCLYLGPGTTARQAPGDPEMQGSLESVRVDDHQVPHPHESATDTDSYDTGPTWHCVPGCPAAALDAQSRVSRSAGGRIGNKAGGLTVPSGSWHSGDSGYGDIGGASRYYQAFAPPQPPETFIYIPKPSPREKNAGCEDLRDPQGRQGNRHPTVKSRKLMRYLITLVTPEGGTVLDCFLGSGTTGVACIPETPDETFFPFIGIERADEYRDLAPARCRQALTQYLAMIGDHEQQDALGAVGEH